MSYHIEVVLFGALILLFSLRRKRRPHKRHGGAIVVLAILIEFLLIAVGIASLISGLFLDVNIGIKISDILAKYIPLLH
jgi:heme A synthase